MPCMQCSNGKYKYGESGKCVYDTLEACKRAAAAIHIQGDTPHITQPYSSSESMSIEDMYRTVNKDK